MNNIDESCLLPLVAKSYKTNHCMQYVVNENVGLDTNFTQIAQK